MVLFLFFLLLPAFAPLIRPPHLRGPRVLAPLVQGLSSITPDENSTVILTLRNTTGYENWKNSQFLPACPSAMQSPPPRPDSLPKGTQSAWAQGQADVCSRLDPSIRWVILPTHTTSAAYLPNWSAALTALASPMFQLTWIGIKMWRGKEESLTLGIMASIGLVWDFGQFLYWIYEAKLAAASPSQASWVSPIAWVTLLGYCVWLKERTDKRAEMDTFFRWARFWLIGSIVAIALYICFISGAFALRRLVGPKLGSQSYTLLDSVSPLIEQVWGDSAAYPGALCLEMIFNPHSSIYSDPGFLQMRNLHLVQFFGALAIWIIWFFGYGKGKKRTWTIYSTLLSLPLQVAGVVLTVILARKGTPFMWNEQCGVVVIAMSSRLGYWDGRMEDHGYMLQIIRAALGLCEYFQRSFNNPSLNLLPIPSRVYLLRRKQSFNYVPVVPF